MTTVWTVFTDDGEGTQSHSVWDTKEQADAISKQLSKLTDLYATVEETPVHSEGRIETFVQVHSTVYPDGAIVVHRPYNTHHLVPQTITGTLISKDKDVVAAIYVEEKTEEEAYKSLAKALKENNLPLTVYPTGFGKAADFSTYLD